MTTFSGGQRCPGTSDSVHSLGSRETDQHMNSPDLIEYVSKYVLNSEEVGQGIRVSSVVVELE